MFFSLDMIWFRFPDENRKIIAKKSKSMYLLFSLKIEVFDRKNSAFRICNLSTHTHTHTRSLENASTLNSIQFRCVMWTELVMGKQTLIQYHYCAQYVWVCILIADWLRIEELIFQFQKFQNAQKQPIINDAKHDRTHVYFIVVQTSSHLCEKSS